MSDTGLIADIGGTNARFALCRANGEVFDSLVLQCAAYPSLADAVRDYFAKTGHDLHNTAHAAFDIACPVLGDEVAMTNCSWRFSQKKLQEELGFDSFTLVNDFIAQALAVPCLRESERVKIGQGTPKDGFPIGVIGPGTGLGVSILIPEADGYRAVASEGGHTTLPAANEKQAQVISVLRQKWPHVSAERVVSGMGLENIYAALRQIKGLSTEKKSAAQVSGGALQGDDVCVEALHLFFDFLGVLAGNLALTAGALGGVYLAGGILPRAGVLELFEKSDFRENFTFKGRFHDYLADVPTYVMTAENPAFLGLAGLVCKKMA